MNILSKVTRKAMWKNRARSIATILGVIVSAAMFMAVVTLAWSIRDYMVRGYRFLNGDFFVSFSYATDEQAKALRKDPMAEQVADYGVLGYYTMDGDFNFNSTYMLGAVDGAFLEQMSVPLEQGRLPENSGELVIPDSLNTQRILNDLPPYAPGDQITLELHRRCPGDEESALASTIEDGVWGRTYTIVGIMTDRDYTVTEWLPVSMLTRSDGHQGDILWYRLFVRTDRAMDAESLGADGAYGEERQLNWTYLRMFGSTGAVNTNDVLVTLVVILFAIIMVASVSLIGNAFSISVSERTKQFGLLSSIGATRKQIRQSVRFEALLIAALGIPVGIVCGYGGIAITIGLLRENLSRLFTFGSDGLVEMCGVFSPLAAVVAAMVCLATILISTWLPSRRATKVAPLEAIRGNTEYKTRPGTVRGGKITGFLFGLPGLLARKYHRVSGRKYRATMFSLAISLVLFTFSGYFSQQLSMTADSAHVENFDYTVVSIADNQMEVYEQLRKDPVVAKSALVYSIYQYVCMPNAALVEEYRQIMEVGYLRQYPEDGWSLHQVELVFLEDSIFTEHLQSEGIDPKPYLEGERLKAIALKQNMGTFLIENDAGEYERYTYYGRALNDGIAPLTTFSAQLPEGLPDDGDWSHHDFTVSPQGEPMLVVYDWSNTDSDLHPDEPKQTHYRIEITPETSGGMGRCNYYACDETGKVREEQPLASATRYAPRIQVENHLEQLPFGVASWNGNSITLVLPLSRLEESLLQSGPYELELRLKWTDYQKALSMLEKTVEGNPQFSVMDHLEAQMNQRGLVTMIRVFSLGFIVLISLISAANVFNTISTNIALRRRDFGMLRSVGMKTGELYRMMIYECLIYGIKALLWGLPVGFVSCYWLHGVMDDAILTSFQFPWDLALIGAGSIFLVVFASMLYGIGKLKKDNPIEAIRMTER